MAKSIRFFLSLSPFVVFNMVLQLKSAAGLETIQFITMNATEQQ